MSDNGYYAARDVKPIDYLGTMISSAEAGQRSRQNDYILQNAETQAQVQKANLEAQQIMRAMQLGQRSKEDWDGAMQTLSQNGVRDAERYIGQWSPIRARRFLETYRSAYGGPGGGGGATGQMQAPADRQMEPKGDEYTNALTKAVAAMSPEQRVTQQRNYDHVLKVMDQVRNPADAMAMVEDLAARRIISPEQAEQYAKRYSDPDTIWDNFNEDFNEVSRYRKAVSELAGPQQWGIPAGEQPSYKSEWDSTNQLGVITKTTPGQKPEFSVSSPGGIPAGGDSRAWPKGLKDSFDAESSQRGKWQAVAEPFLVVKRAADRISMIDANKSNGVEQVAAMYDYVKLLDPTSVVREGEIALLNEARSLMDEIKGTAQKAKSGQILTPNIIEGMKGAAKRLRDIAEQEYRYTRQQSMQSISGYEGYVNADRAFPDFWRAGPKPPPPPTTEKPGGSRGPQPGDEIDRSTTGKY